MTDNYDNLLAELNQVTRERNQALADLADARQALTGVRQALTRKLEMALLNTCRDDCPYDKEEHDE